MLHERNHILENFARTVKAYPNVTIQICYLDLPGKVIKVGDAIYSGSWLESMNGHYQAIDSASDEYAEINAFITALGDASTHGKFCAPYRTNAGELVEVLEAFDENRIRRGIFPRAAFYNADLIKLVIWVFLFDRSGKLLIHKRSANAKDNRSMWDKSVGGHVDFSSDVDTSKTVAREVIEELLTTEIRKKTFIKTNDEDLIFLGEWKPEKRHDDPFYEIKNHPDRWYFFKDPQSYRTQSNRVLPEGGLQRNEVIADVYYLILSDDISEANINQFQNSEFRLVHPTVLKTLIDNSVAKKDLPETYQDIHSFTPDLIFTFTGKIRSKLEQLQNYIIENLKGPLA